MTIREKSRWFKSQSRSPQIQYPIRIKLMSKEETKDYHRRKLYNLSLKSLGEIPQLEEPSDEQKEWVLFRLSHRETWAKAYAAKIGGYENPT